MKEQLYPYQFNYIKERIEKLANAYKSVNDVNIIGSIQGETYDLVINQFTEVDDNIEGLIKLIMDTSVSKRTIEKVLLQLQDYVIPFKEPTQKQVLNVFKKVKKLKVPQINEEQLYRNTYLAWNDNASNRKYIVYYDSYDNIQGFYGVISNQVITGFCTICNKESGVSLFMKTTNKASEGRYTKKGDYICYDSEKCNRQLSDLEQFHNFINKLK
ncbi:elongation factor G-binding protein [Staphylococcus gallinarum]|uniref:Elongation factor G-binding protein n=1 Tax=Staphylococcus gallinarum TaxID=1293 RepID=A0A3A0VI99_STAGA|nr:FusB/FusC family EF-G-binding protein [Staphylococcus gallinarum]RIP33619.1 elongation factor G-binding protein [Staphylococcus gallinarum]